MICSFVLIFDLARGTSPAQIPTGGQNCNLAYSHMDLILSKKKKKITTNLGIRKILIYICINFKLNLQKNDQEIQAY
jgi:hypothetical protein